MLHVACDYCCIRALSQSSWPTKYIQRHIHTTGGRPAKPILNSHVLPSWFVYWGVANYQQKGLRVTWKCMVMHLRYINWISRQPKAWIVTSTIGRPSLGKGALLEVRHIRDINNQTTMAGIRKVLESRYYDKLKLQRALEKRFPYANGKFDLKVCAPPGARCAAVGWLVLKNVSEQWIFFTPEEVTKVWSLEAIHYYLTNIMAGRLEVRAYRYHQIYRLN